MVISKPEVTKFSLFISSLLKNFAKKCYTHYQNFELIQKIKKRKSITVKIGLRRPFLKPLHFVSHPRPYACILAYLLRTEYDESFWLHFIWLTLKYIISFQKFHFKVQRLFEKVFFSSCPKRYVSNAMIQAVYFYVIVLTSKVCDNIITNFVFSG